jgi:hypothetical protein
VGAIDWMESKLVQRRSIADVLQNPNPDAPRAGNLHNTAGRARRVVVANLNGQELANVPAEGPEEVIAAAW